jgi:hypothetical protein
MFPKHPDACWNGHLWYNLQSGYAYITRDWTWRDVPVNTGPEEDEDCGGP